MLIQYLLAIAVMANAFGALSVIVLFWRRGALASRPTLVALSFAGFLYAYGYALDLATVDLSMKLYSLALSYLGVVALPPLLVRAVASHLNRAWLNRASIQIVAWSLSLCLYVLVVTTTWTGFFFTDLRLIENGPLVMLNLEPAFGFYMLQVYVAAAVLLVNVEILRELVQRPSGHRRRLLALMIGSMMPWVANLAYVVGIVPWGLDAPPFLIVAVVGLLVWSLRNEAFGELRPQARDEVVERLSEPVIVTDQHERIIDMNPAGYDLLERLSGEPVSDGTDIDDYPALAEVLERSLDNLRPWADTELTVHDRTWDVQGVDLLDRRQVVKARAFVLHDLTDRKAYIDRLSRLAFEDVRTGLWSFAGFTRELDHHLLDVDSNADAIVAVFNIDAMSDVNDRHGFQAGDDVLLAIGRRLQRSVMSSGIAARLGGDEFLFALLQTDGGSLQEDRARVAAVLRDVFADPFALPDRLERRLTAHCGFTVLGDHERPATELVREARAALSPERLETEDAIHAFTPDTDRLAREQADLADELRRAIDRREFVLHLQPEIASTHGHWPAAEALVRWQHPERGLIAPGAFIGVAERYGLIAPIGRLVLEEACRCLAEWNQAGLRPVRISVNVSAAQFAMSDFSEEVLATVDRYGVPPHQLMIELTESVFAEQVERVRGHLKRLHDAGLGISLDDFGTGYSSFGYLRDFPIDQIKIDRSFIAGIVSDPYRAAVIGAVVDIASTVGATVVAEGVETADQRDRLVAMGCTMLQGYYFSRPVPESAFRNLLETGVTLPAARDT